MTWTNHDLFAVFVALVPALVMAGVLKQKVMRLERDDEQDRLAYNARLDNITNHFNARLESIVAEFRRAFDDIRSELSRTTRLEALASELKFDVRRLEDTVIKIDRMVAALEERTGRTARPIAEPQPVHERNASTPPVGRRPDYK